MNYLKDEKRGAHQASDAPSLTHNNITVLGADVDITN
jgi:hypothetical protein